MKIAKTKQGGLFPTITILGYSNGGDAALDLATYLKTQNITVNLVITCDPVPKSVASDFLPLAQSSWSTGGAMALSCPTNVQHWDNFYQQFDTNSIRLVNWFHVPGGLPTRIWGRTVTGATTNTKVIGGGAPAGAHIWMPTSKSMTDTITQDIGLLDPKAKGGNAP